MNIKEIGATLYLCEGTKPYINSHGSIAKRIEFCNSNPQVILMFLKYLRSFQINEEKLRIKMGLHDGQNEEEIKIFWSQITNIPKKQFIKTQWKTPSTWRKNKLEYGTIAIRYGCVKTFNKINKDIKEIFKYEMS